MQYQPIFIGENPEHFDQWLTQLASEHGYSLSVEREGSLRRYRERTGEGKDTWELETFAVRDRLRLRVARRGMETKLIEGPVAVEHGPNLFIHWIKNSVVSGGFLEVLSAALSQEYQAEAAESGLDLFTYWIGGSIEELPIGSPEQEAGRQEIITGLHSGLPPVAPVANEQMATGKGNRSGQPKKKRNRQPVNDLDGIAEALKLLVNNRAIKTLSQLHKQGQPDPRTICRGAILALNLLDKPTQDRVQQRLIQMGEWEKIEKAAGQVKKVTS